MKRFNTQGMLLFPNPIRKSRISKSKQMLLITECYCPNGHNLVSQRAIFDGHKGIMLRIRREGKEGLVALSPAYGYKSRISLDQPLYTDEVWEVFCPTCDARLPTFSRCACQGDLFVLFLDRKADFSNCILICNRIDCFNAEIKVHDELLHYSGVDNLVI
jgi:hypothetical protein